MRNPFPGMNPYLELHWGDVHTALCAAIRAALQPRLPRDLRARAEERIVLRSDDGDVRGVRRADAIVTERSHRPGPGVPEADVMVAAPVLVEFPDDFFTHRWVQIIDVRDGGKLVTVIEVLSPWNKAAGRTNKQYMDKVEEYLSSDVNFVEIDLLRGSRQHLHVPHEAIPPDRRAPYLVSVNRPARRRRWEAYPLPLREPLPTIAIPCREIDADVPLSLQPLIDQIYVEGGHDDIDYAAPLEPALSVEDQRWVTSLTTST
jgi:hypothetical protein